MGRKRSRNSVTDRKRRMAQSQAAHAAHGNPSAKASAVRPREPRVKRWRDTLPNGKKRPHVPGKRIDWSLPEHREKWMYKSKGTPIKRDPSGTKNRFFLNPMYRGLPMVFLFLEPDVQVAVDGVSICCRSYFVICSHSL